MLRYVCILLCILNSVWLQSHEVFNPTLITYQPFHIQPFYTQNGLPQNQVSAIAINQKGIIYLSTTKGIVTFDGRNFLKIQPSVVDHLPYEKLFFDPSYTFLFGVDGAGELFQVLPYFKKLKASKCVVFDGENIYYSSKNGEIYLYNPHTCKSTLILKTNLKGHVNVTVLKNKLLYSNKKQSFIYSLEEKKIVTDNFSVRNYFKSNNKIIGLRNNEVIDYSTRKKLFELEPSSTLYDFYFDTKNNTYHFATTEGYFVYKKKLIKYNSENGFPSTAIRSILPIKGENIIYIGTGQRGLLKLQLKYTSNLADINRNKVNSLSSIMYYGGSIYYSASDNNIYKLLNGKSVIEFKSMNSIASMNIISDTFYIGTWGAGVLMYKNKKLIGSMNTELNSLVVHGIFKSSTGKIWIGTHRGLMFGPSFTKLKTVLNEGRIITFYERRNGNICVGGSDGIFIFKNDGTLLKKIGKKQGFVATEVRSFYEDQFNNLWIGTNGGGLYCYSKDKLISINKMKNCFLNSDVYTLTPDAYGFLWMTSNQGLFAIQEKALIRFMQHETNFLIPYIFNENHGLYNPEFNGGFYPNYQKTSGSELYFPSIEGLCVFHVKPFQEFTQIGYYNRIIVNNEDTVFEEKINLKPGDYSLRLEFDVPIHNTSRQVFIQYGIQKNKNKIHWNNPVQENFCELSSLSHGNYTIYIRFLDSQNQQKPIIEKFKVTIEPHYYESMQFYIWASIVSFIFTLGIFVHWIQTKRKKEAEKSRIENEFLKLKLASIHSRMNPHFIFNTLSSVKYALTARKWEEAEKLTDEFSLLLREFLSYSEMSLITIQNEADLLKRYLEIEKQRFSNELEISIHIEESIKNVIIPNMLVLPLLENSITHGIVHCERKGKISIEFTSKNGKINIHVHDNGIGFEKSKAINMHRVNHESKGLKLLKDKILNLKEQAFIEIELEIQSSDQGTTIQLIINR